MVWALLIVLLGLLRSIEGDCGPSSVGRLIRAPSEFIRLEGANANQMADELSERLEPILLGYDSAVIQGAVTRYIEELNKIGKGRHGFLTNVKNADSGLAKESLGKTLELVARDLTTSGVEGIKPDDLAKLVLCANSLCYHLLVNMFEDRHDLKFDEMRTQIEQVFNEKIRPRLEIREYVS